MRFSPNFSSLALVVPSIYSSQLYPRKIFAYLLPCFGFAQMRIRFEFKPRNWAQNSGERLDHGTFLYDLCRCQKHLSCIMKGHLLLLAFFNFINCLVLKRTGKKHCQCIACQLVPQEMNEENSFQMKILIIFFCAQSLFQASLFTSTQYVMRVGYHYPDHSRIFHKL